MINWLMFGTLGLIWGSSFLLIKIALRELDAFSLVSVRLGLAAAAYLITFLLLRKAIPRERSTLLELVLIGITNTALPFLLITWSEKSIDSGLAGVLNATTPLFSLVIAHLALHDDKINLPKLLGLISGFAGVALLATRSTDPARANPIEGQLAVLLAALCYAGSAVFIRRRLRHLEPLVMAGVSQMFGALTIVTLTVFAVRPQPGLLSMDVLLAMLMLAIANTFIANVMYFRLLAAWGASRATMVTYLVPPLSLTLGALAGSEKIDARLLIGAALIVGGVAIANTRYVRAFRATSIGSEST